MILLEHPFFNEPGFGKVNARDPGSIAYNKNICLQTTRWAIVDWLKPQHRHGMWANVIKSHFSIRQHKIRAWCVFAERRETYLLTRLLQPASKTGHNESLGFDPTIPKMQKRLRASDTQVLERMGRSTPQERTIYLPSTIKASWRSRNGMMCRDDCSQVQVHTVRMYGFKAREHIPGMLGSYYLFVQSSLGLTLGPKRTNSHCPYTIQEIGTLHHIAFRCSYTDSEGRHILVNIRAE